MGELARGGGTARYSYERFCANVRDRHPGCRCWVCERLLPVVADLGVTMHAQARCKAVSHGIVDCHHLIAKQRVKRAAAVAGDPTWALEDGRNGIPVRRYHHDALERGLLKIPRGMLPSRVAEFAGEIGMAWMLDDERFFPEEARVAVR